MGSDIDPKLRELFAAYAPPIAEEVFLADIRRVLVRDAKKARVRSRVMLGTWVILMTCAAMLSWGPADHLLSALQSALVQASEALPSPISHLCVYGVTLAVGYLGRRQLGAFLAPW